MENTGVPKPTVNSIHVQYLCGETLNTSWKKMIYRTYELRVVAALSTCLFKDKNFLLVLLWPVHFKVPSITSHPILY